MKLGYNIINSFNSLTADEIDFLIHVGQFQDNSSSVGGIDYKSVCSRIDIAKSNFYKIIKSLKNKEIISARTEYDNWIFDILNNNIFEQGGQYVNLNIDLLHSKEFIQLKRNEKVICLNLIKLAGYGKKEICVTFEKISQWTSSKMQSVKRYVHTLENLFKDYIRIEDNKLYLLNKLDGKEAKIDKKQEIFRRRDCIEAVIQKAQGILYWCKKNKIKAEEKDIEDTAKLFSQYSRLIPEKVDKELFFFKQIYKCIEQKGSIIAAYINTLISNAIKEINKGITKEEEHVPAYYEGAFIPYDYCYSIEKMRNRINEILGGTYYDSTQAWGVLKVTVDNLVNMLTTTTGFTVIKGARLTHRQIYEKILQVSADNSDGYYSPSGGSADVFAEFIKAFVTDAAEKIPGMNIKNVEGYLKSWLYDAMDKRINQRIITSK